MTTSAVSHSSHKTGVLMVDTTTTTTSTTPHKSSSTTHASSGTTTTTTTLLDHDDKYGKRDKQLQRGFAILGITSCVLIGMIVGMVLLQQDQDLHRKQPPAPSMIRYAPVNTNRQMVQQGQNHGTAGVDKGTMPLTSNGMEYSKVDAGGVGLFRKPLKRTDPMDKNVKDQPLNKGDAGAPKIRPKHVEEHEENEEDDKENKNGKEDKEDEEDGDGDDKEEDEEEDEEEEDKEEEEEREEEEEEKGDENEEDEAKEDQEEQQ
jgi:hypothetical protein